MKLKNKGKAGITLIALVVTIILLLILAGVSISMLTGENGIINKASTAKTTTMLSDYKEKVDMFIIDKKMENQEFNEESLTVGKNKLIYNTQKVGETGNIETIIPNINKEYIDKIEIIKGKLIVNTTDKNLIKVVQSVGLSANPYIIENGELKSSNNNLLLMDNTGTITIPDSVERIGDGAFKQLNGLKTIIIPGTCKEIGNYAFADNTTLEKVVIEKGVTTLGEFAFQRCTSLKEIELPEGLKTIGKTCFGGCSSLEKINIPNGVENIPSRMLSNCTNLNEIILPNTVKNINWAAFEFCGKIEKITIPESVTYIADGAFGNMKNLNEIVIDEKNNYYVFKDKMLLTKNEEELVDVLQNATILNIPDTVKVFKQDCFETTINIEELTIPSSVIEIKGGLPSNLKKITVKDGNTKFKSVNGNLYDSDVKTLIRYVTNEKEVTLPDTVETLKQRCFREQTNIENLILPETLQKIEEFTIMDLKIKELFIPKNVNYISSYAFMTMNLSISISEDNETYISANNMFVLSKDGETLLATSRNQNSYIIPNAVKTIGNAAFYAKSNLKNIEILGNISKIEGDAFDYCSNLEKVTIGPNVKEISNTAFTRCDKLTTIKVQNKKDSIKNAPWGAPYGLRAVEWAE
mgnify:CR=1 FL=1